MNKLDHHSKPHILCSLTREHSTTWSCHNFFLAIFHLYTINVPTKMHIQSGMHCEFMDSWGNNRKEIYSSSAQKPSTQINLVDCRASFFHLTPNPIRHALLFRLLSFCAIMEVNHYWQLGKHIFVQEWRNGNEREGGRPCEKLQQ